MNFKGKVVVITGGTSGIGKQAAIEFSRKGAHVVAFTVDKEEVCKEAIKEIGNDASYIHCDVSKEEDVKKAIEEVVLKYGRLDCAFNNAGIGPDGVRMPYESLTEISEKTWDLVVDVDMKGVFLCFRSFHLLRDNKCNHHAPTFHLCWDKSNPVLWEVCRLFLRNVLLDICCKYYIYQSFRLSRTKSKTSCGFSSGFTFLNSLTKFISLSNTNVLLSVLVTSLPNILPL